ncbi:MAG TPA: type VI secretion system baseplate subunit TssG [Blastocatellia bacterium]|nr:type VI secretion system baseplate subunit TssG [Blastocatellia bacterium]
MAANGRRPDTPLAKLLLDEPYRFEFFQAVRLLGMISPDRQPVGRTSVPSREVVRFRTRVSLEFPPSQIHQITKADGEDGGEAPPQMMVAFMGLTGPLGVLPSHYTELLLERTRYKDTALWDFLDLFNHRMISLFHRAWEKYRFAMTYERGTDQFTEFLFHMIGMGTRGLRGRMSFPDQALLFYSGLVTQRPHSASAIESIIGDFFGITARVVQFSGQWLRLDDESLSRLGSANSELGVNTVAGSRVWDSQSKFRLRLGPLRFDEFTAFLPTGNAFKPASELVRFLAGMEFDFDVQPVLKAEEVPACILTTRAKRRPMLGWTSWLKTRDFDEDDGQVVLSVAN